MPPRKPFEAIIPEEHTPSQRSCRNLNGLKPPHFQAKKGPPKKVRTLNKLFDPRAPEATVEELMASQNSNDPGMAWLYFSLLTVVSWGVYGIFLHMGTVAMRDAENGRFKAFLFVDIAYFI